MYPRNAASPERISIGPVVQISDGAVQTAGVTVRVLPFGGSEADGVGTVAYSTDGVVLYTPTQAETNYTSFVLIAKKTGCIPASATVVTSESTVTGRVYVATNADKTGYTATVSDKTGFKLASDGLALVTAWTVGITGNLTGNVTGSVGSISGVAFPANFSNLGITVGGAIAELGPNSIPEGAFVSGALSGRVLADGAIDAGSIVDGALNSKGNWLTTLGANAPAGWINAAAITTDAITGDKIAASAVTKVTVGLFKYGDIQRWNSPANQIDVTITKV
jgi:hypothetical protein